MRVEGKLAVVTGGGAGIGREICRCFAAAGAHVVVSDLNAETASTVAAEIGGDFVACDMSVEDEIASLIETVETRIGEIDLFVSNAGILNGIDMSLENAAGALEQDWDMAWRVNVLSHVRAARHLIPKMKVRGGGYFANMVSAAGLLTQIGSATYSTTKHAALGFAENLAITHKVDNIRVSVICPQYVQTDMVEDLDDSILGLSKVLTASNVADAVLKGVEREDFLILPHPEVATFFRKKADNVEQWISDLTRLQTKIVNASSQSKGN